MTEADIFLHVAGVPAPQGSVRAFGNMVVQGGSASSRLSLGDWRTAVATEARRWVDEHDNPAPIDGPVSMELAFHLPKPAAAPRYRVLAFKKPDLSKLIRAVEDSLTKVLYFDDARIVHLGADKFYAIDEAPGVDIWVKALVEDRERRAA